MRPPEQIETNRLLLRVPTIADAEFIFAGYAQDLEVTRYLTWRPHQSVAETEKFLAMCLDDWKGERRFAYSIVLKNKNDVIGMIGITTANFRAELGYVLARYYWGKGIITEAVRALVDWAFSQGHIYRVWAVCDVENVASARVLEKVGMQREGILRRYIMHPNVSDEPRDCYCYSVVK